MQSTEPRSPQHTHCASNRRSKSNIRSFVTSSYIFRIRLALGYGLDGPGSIPGVGVVEIFLHSFVSRLALGSTQPPIKCVPGNFSGVKAAERRTSHPTSSLCRGCEYVDPCIHIPRGPSWPVMGIPLPFFTLCYQGVWYSG